MKMLVCHDGSRKVQAALEASIAMLKREKLEIILATVVEEPADASSYDEASFEALRAKRESDLKEAAGQVAKQGFDVEVVIAVGDARKMLVEAVRKKKPDIVMITSRPPQGGVRFGNVTVSVSDYLLHHITDCPVLVMH
ncbi:MAG: universal stress protein [Gallionellaceae bacterium]|nr:universal stress protein [Gallionellaceae bacterium]